jgi:hypothetical protein
LKKKRKNIRLETQNKKKSQLLSLSHSLKNLSVSLPLQVLLGVEEEVVVVMPVSEERESENHIKHFSFLFHDSTNEK